MCLGACVVLGALGVVYWEFGGIALPWNIDASLVALPFFSLGYYVMNTKWIDQEKNFSSWSVFFLSALLYFLCVSVNGFVFKEKFDMAMNQSGFAPLSFLGILCGIYCIVFFLKHFSLGSIFEYLGKNTMVYFAWHQSIVLPLLLSTYNLLGWFTVDTVFSDLIRCLLTVVLIFVLLYPFDLLFAKSKLRFVIGN